MSFFTRLPFLRWSVLRMGFGARRLFRDWQVGDGREEACARHVITTAKPGDVDAAIRAIDDFAYRQKFLINVGDEKGLLLDRALERANARHVMELGAYVGYSALRIARKLPADGHLFSIEFSGANAEIVRRILTHAGVAAKVTVVHGYLGDGGATMTKLRETIAKGSLDAVFLDHAKEAYVPDLERILAEQWLHPGSVAIADNVKLPGAPEYEAYMTANEGKRWRTFAHETHAEYQTLFKDVVLESTLLS